MLIFVLPWCPIPTCVASTPNAKPGHLSDLSMSFSNWTKWWGQDDVIKWKYFPRYWPFVRGIDRSPVRGINRSPVNSPHKCQWRGVLMFSLICAQINDRVNNRKAGDLRRHRAHYGVSVMLYQFARRINGCCWDRHVLLYNFSFS